MQSARFVLASLTKVELHRHLEGSLRVATLCELAHRYDLDVPRGFEELRRHVEMSRDGAGSRTFLSIFSLLRRFYLSPDVIRRLTREAIEDACNDNIRYLELRFTPVALSSTRRYPLKDVTEWVLEERRHACVAFPKIQIALIASVNRHESVALAEEVLRIAVDHKDEIVGIDLAGDEVNCSAEPFVGVFREAKREGLGVVIHAGEWAGPKAVRHAIQELGAVRIGHGIRVVEDAMVVELARDADVTFEVCPTSNLLSGAISRLSNHPLRRMLALGLKVTLNTDDPTIFNVTLTGELATAMEKLGLTFSEIKDVMLTAAASTFQPLAARESMIESLRDDLGNR